MSSLPRPSRRYLVFTFFLLIGLLYLLFGATLVLAHEPRFSASSTLLRCGAAGIYGIVLLLIWGYVGRREYVSLRNLWLWLLTIAFLFLVGGGFLLQSGSDTRNVPLGLLLEGIALTLGVGTIATCGTLYRRSRYAADDSFPSPQGSGFGRRYGRRSRY